MFNGVYYDVHFRQAVAKRSYSVLPIAMAMTSEKLKRKKEKLVTDLHGDQSSNNF